ncbi:MAG: rod shape-determining protein MreD [Dokdonella sp.]|uniref:rod shape-determining protein MreD n=1 Tax=Dokdonella sp. TaxID=2291710 RepID=UPI0025BC42B5|nr:rod shape-determining protein MreD [Dokdonella sp.]MBX3700673.1 rod shape-determining protein MreD [Dokdonella sp.]MCW5578651.1 rod shape-determining protein MreD [Dokdonella sp.]
MSRLRLQAWLVTATMLAAFALQLMPLPPLAEPFKPYWIGLLVVYWAMETPERMGLGRAFALGLCADILVGQLLGEQAMRLLVLAFIVLRFRARLRFFPLGQQALAVLALLLNDRVVTLMIRGFAGEPMPPPAFWIAPLTGTLAWPLLFVALDRLRLRQRSAD